MMDGDEGVFESAVIEPLAQEFRRGKCGLVDVHIVVGGREWAGFGVDLASPNAKPGVPGTTYDIGINFVPIYLLGKMLNVENPPGNYYSAGASVIFSF